MPGHGLVHTSSPTSPRTGRPCSSNTSTAIPSAGPPSEHGQMGATTSGDTKHAPTSVPPAARCRGDGEWTGRRPARAEGELERALFGHLHEEPAVYGHRALGPAGRAAGVRDEERVLTGDVDRIEAIGLAAQHFGERDV